LQGAGIIKRKWKLYLTGIVGVVVAVPLAVLIWILTYAFSPGPDFAGSGIPAGIATVDNGQVMTAVEGQPGKIVSIPVNSGLFKIRGILIREGIITRDRRFLLTARLFDLTNRLKAGSYFILSGQTPYRILRDMEAGRVIQQRVTIPEGANMYQVADLLQNSGIATAENFLAAMRNQEFIGDFGIKAATLEGSIFPDTYQLAEGQSSDFVIRVMVQRMLDVLNELGVAESNNKPEGVSASYSRHEILTLASIVEKETAQGEERPIIARVFLNRLRRGMLLQTDPTVIYGITHFDGNLRRKDLETPTPYNTYTNPGLPPGPIGNPGRAAIAAVMHPSQGAYLYFVSKNDGTHYFSKSLREHNEAVVKYQKRRAYRRRTSTK